MQSSNIQIKLNFEISTLDLFDRRKTLDGQNLLEAFIEILPLHRNMAINLKGS